MQVFHLGSTKYAKSLTGEGAKLHGGRWNRIGSPCIYTSESKALCVLEYAANVRLQDMPGSISITVYELPEKSWLEVDPIDLPKNWQQVPTPEDTKNYGNNLLQKLNYIALKLPSVIIPSEYNYVLNPLAKHFEKVTIIDVHSFSLDNRIKS
ncbi:MAG TPA: RES family NAD+ phosphorylase [Chitinophagaceae bacterium]|nr:RES family NAD+ phosphorylase [Chitinophagaceae bacterium]